MDLRPILLDVIRRLNTFTYLLLQIFLNRRELIHRFSFSFNISRQTEAVRQKVMLEHFPACDSPGREIRTQGG